jgi:hypothetical protein
VRGKIIKGGREGIAFCGRRWLLRRLGPVSGCLVSVAVLVVLLLFFYGIVVIVFLEAFGVELPNPFGLLRRR